jgi:methyl acetate hydrolase
MDSISELLNSAVLRAQAPGLVAMAANGDRVVYSGAHGRRGGIGSARMTNDTLFQSSSLIRPIIAVAAMQVVDSGVVDLDSRIDELFPEVRRGASRSRKRPGRTPPTRGAPPTMRQLILRVVDARETVSSSELATLCQVIERSSGRQLEAYVRRGILEPLEMIDTDFALAASLWWRMADVRHAVAPGTFQSISRITVDPYALGSSRSALYSTPLDSMKFMHALLRKDTLLLSDRSHRELAAMQGPHACARHAPTTYLGAFNTHVWIDRGSETAGLLYMQLFPHNHPKITALFTEFHAMVLSRSGRRPTVGAA